MIFTRNGKIPKTCNLTSSKSFTWKKHEIRVVQIKRHMSDIIKCRKRSFTPLIPRIRFQHFEIISEKVSSFQKPILSILIIMEFEKTLFTKDS